MVFGIETGIATGIGSGIGLDPESLPTDGMTERRVTSRITPAAKRTMTGGATMSPADAVMTWLHFGYLNDPKQWRIRANEARAHAGKITDPEAKQILLEIIDHYEKLAKRAEKGLVWDQSGATGS